MLKPRGVGFVACERLAVKSVPRLHKNNLLGRTRRLRWRRRLDRGGGFTLGGHFAHQRFQRRIIVPAWPRHS